MNTSTPILRGRQAPAPFPGWLMTMLCLAVPSANQLYSVEDNNPAGRLDSSFELHIQRGWVEAIVMQPDGRLLVGGQFEIPGVGTNLVRFTQDGVPDSSFAPTSGVPRHVTELTLQPDGKVLVGNKGGVDGTYPHIGLSRFLPDGSKDPNFHFRLPTIAVNNGLWSGFWTTALTVQPDGRILLGGYYERDHFEYWYWSVPTLQRILPDGSQGEFFRIPWPYPQYVGVLVLLPDERILVAGEQLARLNADGSEDSGFLKTVLPTPGFVARAGIECCITQADGKILIGGNFTSVQGHSRCRIARMLPDGRLDLSFDPPVSTQGGDSYYTAIRALAVQADGRILVGGNFQTMNGLPYVGLARLNSDGSLDTTFPAVLRLGEDQDTVTVNSILIQNKDRAIIGGEDPDFGAWDLFRIHLGEPRPRLAIHHVTSGAVQLSFSFTDANDFTVLRASDPSLPASSWTVLGSATNIAAGLYQFTDRIDKSEPQRYYRLRSTGPRQQP